MDIEHPNKSDEKVITINNLKKLDDVFKLLGEKHGEFQS
jgi:hypothetical protein